MNLDTSHLMALAAALGWASGLRLYSVLFFTGLAGYLGWVPLPSGLHLLAHPLMLGASGFMLLLEFFADKIPGVDSLWDVVHTVIRIPAGAALAASVFGADQATWAAMAALLGGTLAATSHVAKTTTRVAANTSPEPFTNVGLSLVGDVVAPTSLWLSLAHPAVFGVALVIALIVMVTLIWVLAKYLRLVIGRVRRWTGRTRAVPFSGPV